MLLKRRFWYTYTFATVATKGSGVGEGQRWRARASQPCARAAERTRHRRSTLRDSESVHSCLRTVNIVNKCSETSNAVNNRINNRSARRLSLRLLFRQRIPNIRVRLAQPAGLFMPDKKRDNSCEN